MATVTQQEVAPLHKHLSITINKEDYLPTFEKALKDYSKKANIPGFRKGMVPSGLIRKMYGNSLFVDEVLKTVDREVVSYLQNEQLDIFAQPLPVDMNLQQLDVQKPDNYTFTFEVGMKPQFSLPNLGAENLKRYKIELPDAELDAEIERLRTRYGNMTEPETVSSEENVLNVQFTEVDAAGNEVEGGIKKDNSVLLKYFTPGYRQQWMGKKKDDSIEVVLTEAFEEKERAAILEDLGLTPEAAADKRFKVTLTKIGQVEARELNEEFFKQLFPKDEIKDEAAFRDKLRQEMSAQWEAESRNQLQHSVYHLLIDKTHIDFPADFLKRWMRTQGTDGKGKTEAEVEQEFPSFLNGLKWTLITEKIAAENEIEVKQDDLRAFAKQQLLGYMGMNALDEEQDWVRDYIDRMMKDRKYVEDSYHRIQTQKIMEWAEGQVQTTEVPVSKEDFLAMNEQHRHEHGE